MKLTRKEIIGAVSGLASLSEKSANYTFDHKTRYRIQKNFRILKGLAEDINTAREALVAEIAPKTLTIKPGTEEMTKFAPLWDKFLKETEEAPGLLQFALYKDLNFQANDIPAPVLCDLGPLVLDEEPV